MTGAALISFSGVFVKLAHVGPSESAFYRVLFGGAALLAACFLRGERILPEPRILVASVACGLFFSVDLWSWHRSIHYVGPGLATLLANFQVFFLTAFGILVYRERPNWRYAAGVPLAMLGLFLVVGIEWGAFEPRAKWGVMLGLMAAVAYATYLLSLQKTQSFPSRITPMALLGYVSLFTALFLGSESFVRGNSLSIPDAQTWVVLVAYGLFCQMGGWLCISRGLGRTRASRAGLALLLQPTLAFVWDVWFFHCTVNMVQALGVAMALAAVYLGTSGPTTKRSRSSIHRRS